MNTFKMMLVAWALGFAASPGWCDTADSSLPRSSERNFLQRLEAWEAARSDVHLTGSDRRWELRSDHFVFGMPRLADDRHDFAPEGMVDQPGVSVLVREGFVVAHFDRMKAPLWVAQRWTRYDFARMNDARSQPRPWQEDYELPPYARGGTKYDGNRTELDRGHMARHAMNRGWGADASNWGCKMSNSAPQHRDINRFSSTWEDLEDEVRDVVDDSDRNIDAVWTVTGTVYRDFANTVRLPEGRFGIPDATYKIVCWFDANQRFQARAYLFEQPHADADPGNGVDLEYDLGDPKAPMSTFLVPIDTLEALVGVDFFPELRDDIEALVESSHYSDAWGAQ